MDSYGHALYLGFGFDRKGSVFSFHSKSLSINISRLSIKRLFGSISVYRIAYSVSILGFDPRFYFSFISAVSFSYGFEKIRTCLAGRIGDVFLERGLILALGRRRLVGVRLGLLGHAPFILVEGNARVLAGGADRGV